MKMAVLNQRKIKFCSILQQFFIKVFQLKQSQLLRFKLHSSKCFKYKPILFTNLPKHFDPSDSNSLYYPYSIEIKKIPSEEQKRDELDKLYTILQGQFTLDGTWLCEIELKFTGPMFVQVMFIQQDDDIQKSIHIKGYLLLKQTKNVLDFGKAEWLLVQPILEINSEVVTSDQLIQQSILSRNIGPIERWMPLLEQQAKLGYNCFHFTPIQELGQSGSQYCIKDQLKLSTKIFPTSNTDDDNYQLLRDLVNSLETDHKAISFIDILLNHTANTSEWLLQTPDSYYNIQNTPHLTCALELDKVIQQFSVLLSEKKVNNYHKGNLIENEQDLDCLLNILKRQFIDPLKLDEYFLFQVQDTISELQKALPQNLKDKLQEPKYHKHNEELLTFIKNHCLNVGAKKFGVALDQQAMITFLQENADRIKSLEATLNMFNIQNSAFACGLLKEAMENMKGGLMYQKIQLHKNRVTKEELLTQPYFSLLDNGEYAANNGWIMNCNPLKNFVLSHDYHYFRRSIIIWGDLVKIRYGDKKSDSPFVWKWMKQYVQQMASIFKGFRLDNAHSTPLHVGHYLLKKARKVNNQLIVCSELFTGSEKLDALYAKFLGFNFLVREAQQANNAGDFCKYLNQYCQMGQNSVGSLECYYEQDLKTQIKWYQMIPSKPEALYYDITHDNPSYIELNRHKDCLSKIALLAFSHCFIGTTKGFDEFYPKNVDVVNDLRLYDAKVNSEVKHSFVRDNLLSVVFYQPKDPFITSVAMVGTFTEWQKNPYKMFPHKQETSNSLHSLAITLPPGHHEFKFLENNSNWCTDPQRPTVPGNFGNHFIDIEKEQLKVNMYSNLCYVRQQLNLIQKKLSIKYPEIYIEQKPDEIITVMREHTSNTKHYMLIVRNAIVPNLSDAVNVSINLPGTITKVKHIFTVSDKLDLPANFDVIKGMDAEALEEFELRRFCDILYNQESKAPVLQFHYMPAGFVCILKTSISPDKAKHLTDFQQAFTTFHQYDLIAKNIQPSDINHIMFSSAHEEAEFNPTNTIYNVPDQGDLVYAGFSTFKYLLKRAMMINDIGLPLFNNLRNGPWLLDYLINRLNVYGNNVAEFKQLLKDVFDQLKAVPQHNIPSLFAQVVCDIFQKVQQYIENQVSASMDVLKLQQDSVFFKELLVASFQFINNVPSATPDNYSFTLAAGLPHFSTGWARSWGRDTFISFKGLLLIPGLYKEAKEIILIYAQTLRHGLLPNLLDKGFRPRFNCRDTCWWYIKSISDYIKFTNDEIILKTKVEMLFLDDDQNRHNEKQQKKETKTLQLYEIIQEILQKHATGIKFTEWFAGSQIDMQMSPNGFNIQLQLDLNTGFIFGGNETNCLTWCDKMGSSSIAGNKGKPSTSRNGAPIEMTCLLYHALQFVISANQQGIFPLSSVYLHQFVQAIKSYKDWAKLIETNFEKYYYVPLSQEEDKDYQIESKLVRKRGIYKDIFGCSDKKSDYQMRPQVGLGIAVAPQLFNNEHAINYLNQFDEFLLEKNSIGVKTLAKDDPDYIPFYDNENNSNNYKIAQGFSYHQGPEWIWPYGYYIQALLLKNSTSKLSLSQIMSKICNQKMYLENMSAWNSLPELTNANGAECKHSCQAQAWSISTMIEAIYLSVATKK